MATLGPSSASSATPGGAQEPPRPVHRAGDRVVDEQVRLALSLLLHTRHLGRANAATWERLGEELQAEGLAAYQVRARRLQEAAESLLEEDGAPIVGMSSCGVFFAETADEIEFALREAERRARKTLRRRKLLRRVWLELRGQEALRAVEDAA